MRIGIASQLLGTGLQRVLQNQPECEITWIAQNGLEAVQKCETDIPDILLIDPNLPILDGAETTRRIMKSSHSPILLVTDSVEGNAAKIFEAMGCGAVDAVDFAVNGSAEEREKSTQNLLKKIKTIMRLQQFSVRESKPSALVIDVKQANIPPLIVIGASAGGPKTLSAILSKLSAPCASAIVIIQHVDRDFSFGLTEWLNNQTSLTVQVARIHERPQAGHVYVAGTNDHLVLTASLRFAYTPEPRNMPYRPSVDVFFNSVAKYWPTPGQAIILTGMGRDGAEGLALLRQVGWHTIAQDEATSVVYGMPKAAKEIGAAVEVLPLDQIIRSIQQSVTKNTR
ncbi:chemotaxis response regulator protein-glutamate methylesterase [Candidatus Moduliflexus flocculans]|uniref:protein-glutamate methylesterase n=1 Tax=Candidatus Moduliflexus flocculans TaxID=1499966 RepID=A0A0S6W4H2_9BACT|nr:chemotaxis response regulator protein-glutamate methylesterase [Candidatus Moduliflexus flocculans]